MIDRERGINQRASDTEGRERRADAADEKRLRGITRHHKAADEIRGLLQWVKTKVKG